MRYKLDFDEICEGDHVTSSNGVEIVIDARSLLYTVGMTIDYESSVNGKGFRFTNPNAIRTCGCGYSFKANAVIENESHYQ